MKKATMKLLRFLLLLLLAAVLNEEAKAQCNADFSYTVDTNLTIRFTNLSTPASDSNYYWLLAGGTSTLKNPVKQYPAIGTYFVCLYYNSPTGCYDSICKPVTVTNNPCYTNFTYSINHITKTVTFTNTSTGTDSSFLWNMGNADSSYLKNPVYTYNTNGTYNVCLIRRGPVCFDTVCKTITINNNQCNADFSYVVQPNRTVHFTNLSTPAADSNYYWILAGGTSTLKNPVKQYPAIGTYFVCLFYNSPTGCSDSICKPVVVTNDSNQCNTDFTYSINQTTKTVNFYNTSSGPDSNFIWSMGNFDTMFVWNPTYTYSSNGSYNVCLIRRGPVCFDTVCKTITINGITCKADFTYTPTKLGQFTLFTNTSIGYTDSAYWSFGNAWTGVMSYPDKTYNFYFATPGTYNVCLTIKSATCKDSICKLITVTNDSTSCYTNFTYSVNQATKTVTFTNTSNGPDSSFRWNMGNADSSFLKNLVYTYNSNGTYNVCLIRRGPVCFDTVCKTITINGITCKADFTYTPTKLGQFTLFTNTSIGYTDSAYWSFGATWTGVMSYPDKTYNFYFSTPGTYNVCLTIKSATCKDSICKLITVTNDSTSCYTNFTYSVNQATKTVTFTNTSNGPDSSFRWNMGNADSSFLKNPVYTYNSNGTYNVCLIRKGPICFDTVCKVVSIGNSGCNAGFLSFTNERTLHLTMVGTNDSNYFWTMGNGDSVFVMNPTYTYSQDGTYKICLTKTGPTCFETVCEFVTIGPGCNAGFTYSFNQNNPRFATFTSNYTGPLDTLLWVFGDNTAPVYGTGNTISKYYSQLGAYTVCLFIKNGSCSDSSCKTISVIDSCIADFTYAINQPTKTVTFTNLSVGSGSNYYWSFGDGANSSINSPVHTYGSTGTYNVCLNKNGPVCFDSICKLVSINKPCAADFVYTINHDTKTVTFTNLSYGGNDSLYQWYFDDSTTSTAKNPVHVFPNYGSYLVCLLKQGVCKDSICKTIEILADSNCNANFTYTIYPDSIDGIKRIVLFNNNSTPGGLNFSIWNFGDGNTSTNNSPFHHYPVNGTYHVCLTVIDTIEFCLDSMCQDIYIGPDTLAALTDIRQSINNLNVYPVPVNDVMKITFDSHTGGQVIVNIYNLLGILQQKENKMLQTGPNELEINVEQLPKGIYFIELSTDKGSITKRIIK